MRVLRAVSSGEDDEGGGGRIPIVPQSGDDIKAGERCFFLHGPRPFFYPPSSISLLRQIRGRKNRDTDRGKKRGRGEGRKISSNTRDNAFIARISIDILPPREKCSFDLGGRGFIDRGIGQTRRNAMETRRNSVPFMPVAVLL